MQNQDELISLLERLPVAKDDDDLIWLDGYLLSGPLGCVRLVIENIYLDFHENEIQIIEEKHDRESYAIPARVAVRPGVAILDIGSSKALIDLLRKRRAPFAIAIRESTRPAHSNNEGQLSKFDVRERRFLEKYGLVTAGQTY